MRTISAQQARDRFSDLLGSVYYGKEAVVVKKQGKPMAVLINPETYERLQGEQWERAWAAVDRIRERNKDKDPDEVLADVTEVVEEVRQERYEEEQRTAANGR